MTSRKLTASALILTALAGAGCAADVNPVRDLAVAAGVRGGEPKPAPDFISSTRRANQEFIPVGTSAPKRADRVKSRTEIARAEGELDGARIRNEAAGAAARPPGQ